MAQPIDIQDTSGGCLLNAPTNVNDLSIRMQPVNPLHPTLHTVLFTGVGLWLECKARVHPENIVFGLFSSDR